MIKVGFYFRRSSQFPGLRENVDDSEKKFKCWFLFQLANDNNHNNDHNDNRSGIDHVFDNNSSHNNNDNFIVHL